MLCRDRQVHRTAGIGEQKLRIRTQRFVERGVGNRFVIQQGLAFAVAARRQPQVTFVVFEKDIAAFGARQPQRHLQHGHQDFVEHARRVQLAGRFQKQSQLLEVGGLLRDLDSGNLAQEVARRVRGAVRRIEDGVGRIARAKLQAIVALQLLPLDTLSVHERAVLAALVDEKETSFFQHDERVVARDAGIGDHQILVDLAPDAERSPVKDNVPLLVALHQHQRGKHARAGRLPTAYRIQGHGVERRLRPVYPEAAQVSIMTGIRPTREEPPWKLPVALPPLLR